MDLITIMNNDDRDREINECLLQPAANRDLLIRPMVGAGIRMHYQREFESKYIHRDHAVTGTYLLVRLQDLLITFSMPNIITANVTPQVIDNIYREEWTDIASNELSPRLFEVATHYRLSVFSPMDYVHLLVKHWNLVIPEITIDALRITALLLPLNFQLYRYHPSQIAISLLAIFDIVNDKQNTSSARDCAQHVLSVLVDSQELLSTCDVPPEILPAATLRLLIAVSQKFVGNPIMSNHSNVPRTPINCILEVSEFDDSTEIGSGGYGAIYKITINDTECAVKLFFEPGPCLKEYANVQHLTSNSIVKPLGYGSTFRDDDRQDYLVYPLALYDQDRFTNDLEYNKITPDSRLIASHVIQLVIGLSYLHHRGIAHRDVNQENILMFADARVRLTDLGGSSLIRGDDGPHDVRYTNVNYSPPENFHPEQTTDAFAADVWGLGCIVFNLLSYQTVIDYRVIQHFNDDSREYMKEFDQSFLDYAIKRIPEQTSDLAIDFVGKLLTIDRTQRPTIDEVQQHPFYRECVSQVPIATFD